MYDKLQMYDKLHLQWNSAEYEDLKFARVNAEKIVDYLEKASMVSTSITIDARLLNKIAETLRDYHSAVDKAFERFDNDYRELNNKNGE